jgi:hypothetical protein
MELNFPRTPKPIQKRSLWKSAVFALTLLILAVFAFFIFSHPDIGCKLINRPFVRYSIPGYENDEFGGCLGAERSSFRPRLWERIIFP